jgi:hypothetical protein
VCKGYQARKVSSHVYVCKGYQDRKVSGHECVLGVSIQESEWSRMCVRGTNPRK